MILLSFFKTTSTVFHWEKCIFFIEIGKFVYFILNTSPIFADLCCLFALFFHLYFGCQTFSTWKILFGEGKETEAMMVLNALKTTCVTNTMMILIRKLDLKSALYYQNNNMNTIFTNITTNAITVWGKCRPVWEEF